VISQSWWLSTCIALPSYAFIAKDYTNEGQALYTTTVHRQSSLMVGLAFRSTGCVFFIRDYDPEGQRSNECSGSGCSSTRKKRNSSATELCIPVPRFHTLGLYVHNDVVVGLRYPREGRFLRVTGLRSVSSSLRLAVCLRHAMSSCRMPTGIASTAWPNYGAFWLCLAGWKRSTSGTNDVVPSDRPW